ncbi:MAG: tetratricopeptide repeat protein [Propionibacterium sp.]|nr:tetratricopeptide repeat protein [Propionibacterium sp.]
MTSSNFSRPGAVDLSALKAQAPAPGQGGGSAGGGYVVDVTVQTFEDVMRKSLQHPVLVELWSPRANAEAFSADLAALAAEGQGRWLLARANVDEQPQIAQALQVQGVPTLAAVIGGQMIPLAQGPTPRAQLVELIEQVMQAAVANGIVGRAEPVAAAPTEGEGEAEAAPDPRFAAADEALERGDFAAAREEFDKLVKANPNDTEAIAGAAQAGLLARAATLDPADITQRLTDDPSDLAANLDAADLDFARGDAEAAFNRLLDVIRARRDEERETARVRLLELFTTLGNADPRVIKARRALTSALF